MKRIIILGGGASGLMAAISAAKRISEEKVKDIEIIILERCDKVARKLLATGNGRCNLSNERMDIKYFFSNDIDRAGKILDSFNLHETINLFKEMGLMTQTDEEGRIYPYSLQASTVLDILRNTALDMGVVERCSVEVTEIKYLSDHYWVKAKNGEIFTGDVLVMAAGGCASPKLGSNGSGYKLLESLGHKITDIFPAITQVRTQTDIVKSIQGIKVNGGFKLKIGEKLIYEDSGEILFTEYGISGPLAFNSARYVGNCVRMNKKTDIAVYIDLMPEYGSNELMNMFIERAEIFKEKKLEQYMIGLINKRVGQAVLKISGFSINDNVSQLKTGDFADIVKNIKAFKLKCIGTQSFQNAQVTAGGAVLKEFNENTLESCIIPGLFACGEILDADGQCGGYNLQWAWSSGYIAGRSAADAAIDRSGNNLCTD